MTDTATTEQPTTGTALVTVGLMTPAIFEDPNKVDDLLAKLEKEVLTVPRDISTEKGREAIRSLAYKVARSKTALDEMGKNLVEDWKSKAGKVDKERRKVRERCDKLRDDVRQPLTDWEEAESARVTAHEDALVRLFSLSLFSSPPTSAMVRERVAGLTEFVGLQWQEFTQRAATTFSDVKLALETQLARAQKAEADAAELDRLRAEQVEREQREHDARIADEAAERARLEAEIKAKREAEEVAERAAAEQRRVEAERQEAIERADRADQERLHAIARAEEDRRLALEERERAAREHQEAIAKAEADRERQAEEAEARAWQAAEQAERNRVAAIEAERKRVADERALEEQAAAERMANDEHRRTINNKAREALELFGVPVDRSRNVVTAIAKGEIPNVSIAY
jgi:hypothetical protein